MSSAKRRRVSKCHGTTTGVDPSGPPPHIPDDHKYIPNGNRMRSSSSTFTSTVFASSEEASRAHMYFAMAANKPYKKLGVLTASIRQASQQGWAAAMSSAKRRRLIKFHGTTTGVDSRARTPKPSSVPPHIPEDILLEIFARSDTRTIARAAATCKPLRRALLSPHFLRHAVSNGGGFDPGLLLGASCVFYGARPRDVYFQDQRHPFTFEAESLGYREPMASRGCLVVLHPRGRISAELRVVNALTGRSTRVPTPHISAMYPRALLAVGDGGRSFELLVAGTDLVTRVYSSERGEWGDKVRTRLPPDFINTLPNRLSPALVVLGSGGNTVVHWLCREQCIVALDVGAASAAVIELPRRCFRDVVSCPSCADKGLLASSPDGRLSLLVAGMSGGIKMWSLSSAAAPERWTLQVVVRKQDIARHHRPGCAVRFLRFGERSGAVMVQVKGVGLVMIDLGTREARVLSDKLTEMGKYPYSLLQLCLHETDRPTLLESMTKNMKRF